MWEKLNAVKEQGPGEALLRESSPNDRIVVGYIEAGAWVGNIEMQRDTLDCDIGMAQQSGVDTERQETVQAWQAPEWKMDGSVGR